MSFLWLIHKVVNIRVRPGLITVVKGLASQSSVSRCTCVHPEYGGIYFNLKMIYNQVDFMLKTLSNRQAAEGTETERREVQKV